MKPKLLTGVGRGAAAALAFSLAGALVLPREALVIVIVLSVAAGAALAGLMARGRPFGPERAARVALQASSLFTALCVVMPQLASRPMPTAVARALGVDVNVLAAALPLPPLLRAALAVPLVVVGVVVVALAMKELLRGGGTADPFDPPVALATTGLYARMKHPMQLGQIAVMVGVALVEGTLGALFAAMLFTAALVGPVRVLEAEQMRARFGER